MNKCGTCQCEGWPFCTSRIFPKKKGVGCGMCGCTSCYTKLESRWRACVQCRNYYIPAYNCCRCHSEWVNCRIPYFKPVFRNKVYESSEVLSECTTCSAKIFPYSAREPCNFKTHFESHGHRDDIEMIQSTRTKTAIQFCILCEKAKNVQCPFCVKKFGSFDDAERHIKKKHADLKDEDPATLSCVICANKKEWESVKKEWPLAKWINFMMSGSDEGREQRTPPQRSLPPSPPPHSLPPSILPTPPPSPPSSPSPDDKILDWASIVKNDMSISK